LSLFLSLQWKSIVTKSTISSTQWQYFYFIFFKLKKQCTACSPEHGRVVQSSAGWRVCLQSCVQSPPATADQSHIRQLRRQTGDPSGEIQSLLHHCSRIHHDWELKMTRQYSATAGHYNSTISL